MPDEPNLGGNLFDPNAFGPAGGRNRRGGRNVTGTASASLKFDIPGLKDFRTELTKIDAALVALDKTFRKIAKAPAEWAKALEEANKQLREMKANTAGVGGGIGGVGGGGGGATGIGDTAGSLITPSGGRSSAKGVLSGIGKWANVFGKGAGAAEGAAASEGGMAALGGSAAGGAAAVAGPAGIAIAASQAVGKSLAEGVKMMFERFDRGMNVATASDVYASRRALAIGQTAPEQWRQYGNQGNYGFYGGMEESNAVLYQGQSWGAFAGGQGVGGQRGAAFQQSIGGAQAISPGMTATQAAGLEQQRFGNVQGMKAGFARYGRAVLPYTQGGKAKTQQEQFRDILRTLERLPRRNGKRGAWTREQLEAQRYPGSSINAHLAAMGLPDELIEAFWEYAIANSASQAAGQGELSMDPKAAQKQLEEVTGGSLAHRAQQLETDVGERDTRFGAQQYGTMKTRMENESRMVGLLTSVDGWLAKIYNVLGGAPSGVQGMISGVLENAFSGNIMGMAGSVLSGVGSMLSGDPGYIGDAEGGLSHLTPDLRQRVGKMMGDNPNLKINSAYRNNLRQQQLQGKGPFAPSGKSMHGRGQAVDLGPASQHGWLASNAKKYGIDMAGHMGEPWHAQLSGTLGFMGDPVSPAERACGTEQSLGQRLQGYRASAAIAAAVAQGSSTGAMGEIGNADGGAAPGSATPSGGVGTGELRTVDGYAGAGTQAIMGSALDMSSLVKIVYNAGFRGDDLVKMAAISMRESGGGAYRYAYVPKTKDKSYGLWMMNAWDEGMAKELLGYVQKGGGTKLEDMYDPQISANAAYNMWSRYGYRPWGGYKGVSETHGVKDQWLSDARTAAKSAGYLGDPTYGADDGMAQARAASQTFNTTRPGGSGSFSLRSSPVTFNNTFHVTVGSGSRATVDVAARQIAARLEAQVNRVVSRKN